jgi:uncharacterized protein YyaL (SSP411 family)
MSETLPGATAFPRELSERLASAVAALGPGYVPRTHHRIGSTPRFTNRLILESSPYLLQHAHNPVNWYPWGDEAFAEARRARRPVLLSIGYSTCHWCHVMEEESFEDLEVAQFLNEHTVCIKVDREERPDVDAVYMTAVQVLTGGGGWPMSVWLNADREPFFAGTYFPARDGDRGAQRGLLSILRDVADVWERDPLRVSRSAGSLAAAVRVALESTQVEADALPGPEPIESAVAFFAQLYDERHGGVRRAPKFPSNLPVRLLLRHHRRTRSQRSLEMAALTLEKMAAGGIHDQLGGGFHRYSTDSEWLVPHFEKMLYDNALLAVAYAEASQLTGRRDFARVVRQTLDDMLRDMTAPEGCFYSATDADSEGVEGKFFVWTEKEIRDELGPDADRFIAYYGVTQRGNFEGANILHVSRPDEAEWEALAGAREKLRHARERRSHPLRDDKVVTAWNGLMISGFAFGGRVLAEPRYLEAALRAAEFLLSELRPGGRLLRSWRSGRRGPPGYLEDHAFLAQGLLDLYEATFDARWLEEARALAEATEDRFADRDRGGWLRAASDGERLIARERPMHDGAEPSGASVALLNALRLSAFTADDRWRRIAERALRLYAPVLNEQPAALTEMLLALDFQTDAPREVVLVWPEGGALPEGFLEVLRSSFLPNRALAGASEGPPLERLGRIAKVAAEKKAIGGRATAYVCERGSCRLPAIEPEKLRSQIEPIRSYR